MPADGVAIESEDAPTLTIPTQTSGEVSTRVALHVEPSADSRVVPNAVSPTVEEKTQRAHNGNADENVDEDDAHSASSKGRCDSDSSTSSISTVSSKSETTLVSESSDEDSSVLSSGDESFDSYDDSASELSARMKRKFKMRDKILKRLARGKSEAYTEFLKENEKAVRNEAAKLIGRKRKVREARRSAKKVGGTNGKDTSISETRAKQFQSPPTSILAARDIFSLPSMILLHGMNPKPSSTEKREVDKNDDALSKEGRSFADTIYRLCLFDFYHTLPGFMVVILYCLAHISVYELLSNSFIELTRNVKNQNCVYACTLGFALFLMRLSGGVWYWVNEDRYSCVKFDMHNRLRMHEADARILRWFRKHMWVKCLVHTVSLYLCFMSVYYFLQNLAIPTFIGSIKNNIMEELPSLQYEFCTTRAKEILFGDGISSSCSKLDLKDYKGEKACFDESNTVTEDGAYCYNATELADALTEEDEDYIFSKASVASYYAFFGDENAAILTPWSIVMFYFMTTVFSISLLFKSGLHFWEM